MPTEPWVSVEDANHFGIAKDSVYRWIDRTGLPVHKIGRLWEAQLSDPDAWIKAGAPSRLAASLRPRRQGMASRD